MVWIQQKRDKSFDGVAPSVRTGGSRHTGQAAPPHRNIHNCQFQLINRCHHQTWKYNSGNPEWCESGNNRKYPTYHQESMLGDISKAEHIYLACGYTDMRNYVNLFIMGSTNRDRQRQAKCFTIYFP
jgi:hypothetical protein